MQFGKLAVTAVAALASLLVSMSSVMAVTMKAVITGNELYDTTGGLRDYFPDVDEGTKYEVTFIYELTNLDSKYGGIGGFYYGTLNPIKSAKLKVGDTSPKGKSYEFATNVKFGHVTSIYKDERKQLFMLIVRLSENNFNEDYIYFYIATGVTDRDGKYYTTPEFLSTPFNLIADPDYPIGVFYALKNNSSDNSFDFYVQGDVYSITVSRLEEVSVTPVPLPGALPLLASVCFGFAMVARRRIKASSDAGSAGCLFGLDRHQNPAIAFRLGGVLV
jgi:hypothetical protein